MTISGNGTWKAKIATKEAAARSRRALVRKVRRPIRNTASATMATTAPWSPKSSPATQVMVPYSA
jgi:hypothetical protein